MTFCIEDLIDPASRIRSALEQIIKSYKYFLLVIEDEHLAIERSDIDAIGEISKIKTKSGLEIENAVHALRSNIEVIRNKFPELQHNKKELALGEIVSFLQSLTAENFGISDFSFQVFSHIVEKLSDLHDQYREIAGSGNPKIEMNKYLVAKLLKNHQETYRFWQEVARDSGGTYDGKGGQKSGDPTSVITVRA